MNDHLTKSKPSYDQKPHRLLFQNYIDAHISVFYPDRGTLSKN